MGNAKDGNNPIMEEADKILNNLKEWQKGGWRTFWQERSPEEVHHKVNDAIAVLAGRATLQDTKIANALIDKYNDYVVLGDYKVNYKLLINNKDVFAISDSDDAVLLVNGGDGKSKGWFQSTTSTTELQNQAYKIAAKDGIITEQEKQLIDLFKNGKEVDQAAVEKAVRIATSDKKGIDGSEKELIDLMLKINPDIGVSNIQSKNTAIVFTKKDAEITNEYHKDLGKIGDSDKFPNLVDKYSQADSSTKINYELEAKARKKQQELSGETPDSSRTNGRH